jgi:tetratricopeptide (TPR) repeat protein
LIIIVLGGIGSLIWWQAPPVWNSWRQEKALNQVETFAEKGDCRNALIALRRATESDPSDPRVWREAATFLARIGSSECLVAHRNLARLDPGDVAVQIALVTEPLRFDDLATARNGLEKLESAGRADSAFHRLAAAVALALNKQEEFVDQLKKLVAIDPTDSRAQLQLAAIELWSDDQPTSARGWAKLEPLLTAPEVRLRVALERLNFVAQGRNSEKVDQEVAKLLPLFKPETTKQQIVRDQPDEPPGWNQLLDALGDVAGSEAEDAARYINWLSRLGLETRASTWINSLSEEAKKSPEVLNATLVLAAKLNDLERLHDLLTDDRLSHIPSGTISLLIASRLQETRFDSARGIATWKDALHMSNDSLAGLRIMARLAGIWKNQEGLILALERIVSRFPRERWAYDALRFI